MARADEARRIRLRGVRVHNLKGIDLDLPLNRLIVFSGVSGSGKSSLAFDTLYAEGQRRYIETFSAYTRQFLEKLDKPDADRIDGIPPALAIAQRVGRRSIRSTVGTVTEIHDALALLFARVGRVVCRSCGDTIEPATPDSVAAAIDALPDGTRYQVAFPIEVRPDSDRAALAAGLREDGFARVRSDGQTIALEGLAALPMSESGVLDAIVDRLIRGRESAGRRLDSIELAFARGLGRCRLLTETESRTFYQGWRCGRCGIDYQAPDPRLFRYNSPLGACPTCEGFGRIIDLDLARIVPDRSKTLRAGAVAPWMTPAYRGLLHDLIARAPALGLPLDTPFEQLTPEQVGMVVEGVPGRDFGGLRGFFRGLEKKSYKMHVRVFLSRWRRELPCPACQGARLRPEALAVRVGGEDIAAISALKIGAAAAFLDGLPEAESNPVARRIVRQLASRLDYLKRIGLDYLTLDRPARTLSGGESQRVALTSALGSGLVNMLYVLDEPSVGLHPHDVGRLIGIVERLRDAGNTVVAVEHEEAVLRAADVLVDIGPGAGEAGGTLLYAGPPAGVEHVAGSATGDFLSGRRRATLPDRRRSADKGQIRLTGASGHNLKAIDVTFPLGVLCVVTGVSGSGKSTLIEETLYPALKRHLGDDAAPLAPYADLTVTGALDEVVLVDQTPIGRSARSNPVTYLKAFDEVRKTFAATHEAKVRNYGPSQFSFNVEGGRCNACEGNGYLNIDMQFLPDVMVRCPECRGARYRPETLEVAYRGKTIAEVLELTAREAFLFFRHRPKVQARLRPLLEVGLDYLRLGQPASTLSGGEAQRLKLASFLSTSPGAITRSAAKRTRTLFLLDEPTTGLHPADTLKLLDVLNSLIDRGHALIVIEHSPDVMAAADWIVDLGPGAGDDGGHVIGTGTPEEVARLDTPTGRVVAEALAR